MKAITFIFAFFLFSTVLTSCTADTIAEDEALYSQDTVFATGEESTATYDNSRD